MDHVSKRYLTPQECGTFIGVAVQTLARWRTLSSSYGPPFIKVGARKVMYSTEDLVDWMEKQRALSTSELASKKKNKGPKDV